MNRTLLMAVVVALALPVLALAAMIGQQERLLLNAQVLNVPLIGVDPRDLLRGRYLVAQLDWDWDSEPTAPLSSILPGGLCVIADDRPKPRVRFVEDWKPGDRAAAGCRLMIAGSAWPRSGASAARFLPDDLDAGGGRLNIFVPETQAPVLEKLIRERPGALTVDLAVRADGRATIKAVRVDGKVLGG